MDQDVNELKFGSVVGIRIGKDISQGEIDFLNQRRRANPSYAREIFFQKLREEMGGEFKGVSLPVPKQLNDEQRERLSNPDVKEILGTIVYSLLNNEPVDLTFQAASEDEPKEQKPKKALDPALKNLLNQMPGQ